MNKSDAINHFGSVRKLAARLGISPQAVYKWPEKVPRLTAMRLDEITDGELVFSEAEYEQPVNG